jgi:hypothetical protein
MAIDETPPAKGTGTTPTGAAAEKTVKSADASGTPGRTVTELAEEISANVAFVVSEMTKPADQRNADELQKKTKALNDDAASIHTVAETLTDERNRANQQLQKIRGVVGDAGAAIDALRHPRGVEFGIDVIRLAIVWGVAAWAWYAPGPAAGKVAIWLADGYIVIVLMTAAIRSDETYAFRDSTLERILYEVMPSRLFAPLFVVGLFCALWWGFAGLYADPPKITAEQAQEWSFLILATFDGPNSYTSLDRALVLCELGSAILLLICVFSMLINRISEF